MSEQVKKCIDLGHCLHWVHLEPTYLVDVIQVHKGTTVSQSKSGNVWIYSTVCTGYTWSPLTLATERVVVFSREPTSSSTVPVYCGAAVESVRAHDLRRMGSNGYMIWWMGSKCTK